MKKLFWRGLLLFLSFSLLLWLVKKIILILTGIWKNIYHLLIPFEAEALPISVLNTILLIIFSLICTLLVVIIIGFVFSIKIKGKSLADALLRYFSQIPGIKFLVKLISRIIEASESFHKKELKLALYKDPAGKRTLGAIKLKEVKLIYKKREEESVIAFYEPFAPYIISGKPYLVPTKNLYEVLNLSFEEYLEYVATAGLFFELPKKIFLRGIKDNTVKEIPIGEVIKNSKSAD